MKTRKAWNDLTTKEANSIRDRHCQGCKYLYGDKSVYMNCNYILIEHKPRGCDVRDCKLNKK